MTKKHKKKLIIEVKDGAKRGLAGTLALYMFLTATMLMIPTTQTYALTGGASQPEVQSFEPIGTSDMVNLFSGDMTYNIPLLDVEGYPINLAYNSGVTMDQEASWVGLGWNVNVGTINRAVRGLPDDFDGEIVTTTTNIKKNWTLGLEGQVGDIEIVGKGIGLDFGYNVGVNFNSYNGLGFSTGFNLSSSTKLTENFTGSTGLGLNSSSSGGLDISPSLGLKAKLSESEDNYNTNLGSNIGSSFNSRSGVSSLSIGVSFSATKELTKSIKRGLGKGLKNTDSRSFGTSTSFDFMQSTYTPSITNSMRSFAITGRVKVSVPAMATDPGFSVGINYSEQVLKDKILSTPSYGYLYSHNGQTNKNARHDFNRENQGSVSASTPNLALTNYTYDIYSVSGQGVGGSYRPFRNQVGYVYDNHATNNSTSIPVTIELGAGGLFHGGTEIGATTVRSESGPWTISNSPFDGDNLADNWLNFARTDGSPDYERVVFREANEASVATDEQFYQLMGEDRAVKIQLNEIADYNVQATNILNKNEDVAINIIGVTNFDTYSNIPITRNFKQGRDKRNSTIQHLTIKETKQNLGIHDYISGSYAQDHAKPNQIGQIVSLGNDGLRYVYGQPAFNIKQQEVTFAVGQKLSGVNGPTVDYSKGLVSYNTSIDDSENNDWGLDNYFQRVETPAYAHSYLLTAVLSDDYVDVDGIKGPSEGDLGSYTKFEYEKLENNYKWRVPVEPSQASFNEGLKGDFTDDKASYIYGEKELFYLDKIVTKNFVAEFHKSNREDALGVVGSQGGNSNSVRMQKLDSISLYTKTEFDKSVTNPNYEPIVLKTVHFVYDYELCPNTPNSNAASGGKLTLKKVYFTYRDSQKGKISPYEFTYCKRDADNQPLNNYPYHLKGYDRWGSYKPPVTSSTNNYDDDIPTYEYPYVEQDKDSADLYTTAWTLTKVSLPSGGSINIDMESDDYRYVQHKEALEMFKINNVGKYDDNNNISIPDTDSNPIKFISENPTVGILGDKNKTLYFDKDPNVDIDEYMKGIKNVYFRCLMEFDNPDLFGFQGRFDYVSGYADIKKYGEDPSGAKGWILLEPVSFNDIDGLGDKYSPIALAGVQFGQLHLSRYVWDSPNIPESGGVITQTIANLYQTFANFVEGFKNPNKTIFDKGRGIKLVIDKSWIRLNNASNYKLGGGSRVQKISINDNWADMINSSNQNDAFDYGQEYDYTIVREIVNGVPVPTSSGVASYEPQIGGDENPWKQPVVFSEAKKLAPDQRFYQETPFGESFFPSASVGYSKVTVRNLEHSGVSRNATGKVVHEFYTAKEFPTLTEKTKLQHIQHKSDPFSIQSIFKIDAKDFYTGSQGFVVITNDMHGKPKSQSVYQEDQEKPITKVEYFYQQEQGSSPSTFKLNNKVNTVFPNGDVATKEIGVNADLVADFNENNTKVKSLSVGLNLDLLPVGPLPFPIPSAWPSYSDEKTSFKSATMTKVVQKFGVLENTKATDLGSVVETKNLAYDAHTGQVLLTETVTNFNDKVYSMNFPAYWHYDNMGQAYKNIGFTLKNATVTNGICTHPNTKYFVEGDEIAIITSSNSVVKAWVVNKNNTSISIQLASGLPPSFSGGVDIKVLRSGRRNMQSQMMASVTTLSNPLHTFKDNIYKNVLQASAIEFSDEWRTYCNCNGSVAEESINPYFLGTRGNYRPKVSYLHLSDRTQSDKNNNTYIRKDGMFESYRPYYKLNSVGEWGIDRKDWTYTASVTEFNPFGQELENQDALGRFSSAQFGFNQTLAKAVAANAGYRDMGFSSFEDDDFSECADNHFKFEQTSARVMDNAHSGRYSVKVTSNNPVTLKRTLIDRCDKPDCAMFLTFGTTPNPLNIANDFLFPIVTGNNGVYTYDIEIISGSPNIVPRANLLTIDLEGTYSVEYSVTDEKGCFVNKYIHVVNGNLINN